MRGQGGGVADRATAPASGLVPHNEPAVTNSVEEGLDCEHCEIKSAYLMESAADSLVTTREVLGVKVTAAGLIVWREGVNGGRGSEQQAAIVIDCRWIDRSIDGMMVFFFFFLICFFKME